MKISEVIDELTTIKDEYGDIDVANESELIDFVEYYDEGTTPVAIIG